MLRRWFLDHPSSVGESYFGHQRAAFGFAFTLLGAAAACFIHGLVPGLFERTGSSTVARLHARLSARQTRALLPVETPEAAPRARAL